MIKNCINKRKHEVIKEEKSLEEYKQLLQSYREEITRLDVVDDDYYSNKTVQNLRSKLYIPANILVQMDYTDICFYVLNSDSFKVLAEYTESITSAVEEVLVKITKEECVYKYSKEESINLLYFYGNILPKDGITNLVYNIVDKCHGDMGVYTSVVKNLAELNHIEGIEIVYSAISFKYSEDVAKRLMGKLGIQVNFSKTNKVI